MQWFVDRLKEPSTWAGLGVALVALGVIDPIEFDAAVLKLTTVVAGLSGFVAAFLSDK